MTSADRGRAPTVTTASGSRDVPYSRAQVWRALTALDSYCAVCDVSYVLDSVAAGGKGTLFRCVPGRLDDRPPPDTAVRGEIVEWTKPWRIRTRLDLAAERWTTTIALTDRGDGVTRVTVTVSLQPREGSRPVRLWRRRGVQRLVQRTVDGELTKLPAHLDQASPSGQATGSPDRPSGHLSSDGSQSADPPR